MFSKGDVITSPKWIEPVQVDLVEDYGNGYVRILGVGTESRERIDQIFTQTDLEKIQLKKIELSFTANADDVFLVLENIRYRFISLYDPLLAINTSKVDPLPHQIEAVYGIVLKLGRIRFLIADDPGAGKTIMAGLIIKELKLRHLVNRVLIVAPGHLKDQWRRELKERFEETFIVIDRSILDTHYGENVWQRENQVITSIDFAKQDEILPTIAATNFDLIIVDEAHKMSAYQYGEKTSKSKRYKLGEVLSDVSEHLLFLTATPHKGDTENFRLFLDLLSQGFFASTELLVQSIENQENPLFIRRIKEDLKDFEGKPLFLPRKVETLGYDLGTESPHEKILYNHLSRYVNTQYNKALSKDRKRNVAFALVILQRRFASSIYALFRSLERRKNRLQELLSKVDSLNAINNRLFDFEDTEDLSEEERWKEEEMMITLTASENREELLKEIEILDDLYHEAKKIIDDQSEIKLRQLKSTLDDLNARFPNQKIIIFTESRDTLDYLEKRITNTWGYTSITIHGGMRLDERIEAEKKFKNENIQVLVATEAAGEGINLQFCHLMINYDIPWNPNRLEQRMGRIHRYGQNKEVFIYNLVAKDTREGEVLTSLFHKLDEIKRAMGSDKVFDVISEVLVGKNLSQLLIDASINARSKEEILKEIDIVVDEAYIQKVKDNLGDTLATRFIDYTRIKELSDRAKEYRLIPEYTEAFFKKAFEKAGGQIVFRKDGFVSIESIPFSIKQIANEINFKKRHGLIASKYRKGTFDKQVAIDNSDCEFISFGHPLFEAVMIWIDKAFLSHLKQGAVFKDPENRMDGLILYYEAEIKDGKREVAGKRLFAFYYDLATKSFQPFNTSRIWDLSSGKNGSTIGFDLERLKLDILPSIFKILEDYKEELLLERNRQAEIKEKYGLKSLNELILRLDYELGQLFDRKENGDNVDLAIHNKKEQQQIYEQSRDKLSKEIQLERNLSIENPRFLGAIKVVPSGDSKDDMFSDADIEKIGMDVAMEYERSQGRFPQDVALKNLGYDIYSVDEKGNTRRIEVKARAATGAIALTINEMFKARRFGKEYYLYVVFNASTNPDLLIINDPAESLNAIEKQEVVRFIIDKNEILSKGIKQ
ncbi:MAG TPA: helicase-related protein [Bacteroidales bacterium]|nr:helicase-related protein [Bacteroidales bacterium]HPI84881.1 helicase-related protein [Bacteroidales bacterium]